MEKKKLLLVAVSVGVVLLIMIGIPLMLISPRQPAAPSWQPISQIDPGLLARPEPPAHQEPFPQQPEAPAIIAPAHPPQPPAPAFPPAGAGETPRIVTTITVPPPRAAAVPVTPPAAARPPAPARPAPAAPQVQPARTPAAVVAAPAPAGVRNNFWIQAGAFRNKVGAEYIRETLEAKGISSIIENRNINGNVYYRVRIGPYLSETEANYWLALVRSIDGFALSQVRVSQAPAN